MTHSAAQAGAGFIDLRSSAEGDLTAKKTFALLRRIWQRLVSTATPN